MGIFPQIFLTPNNVPNNPNFALPVKPFITLNITIFLSLESALKHFLPHGWTRKVAI